MVRRIIFYPFVGLLGLFNAINFRTYLLNIHHAIPNQFQEIVDTYAQKDEKNNPVFSDDGSQILIKEDMIEECNQALEDLQELEIEIETYGLSLEDLGENIECTPEELEALMPFME